VRLVAENKDLALFAAKLFYYVLRAFDERAGCVNDIDLFGLEL
jgi:hypothetical protein